MVVVNLVNELDVYGDRFDFGQAVGPADKVIRHGIAPFSLGEDQGGGRLLQFQTYLLGTRLPLPQKMKHARIGSGGRRSVRINNGPFRQFVDCGARFLHHSQES